MKFKSLKKASAVLLCALITLAGVLNVFAAGQTYSIPEASNMQITLPEDMTAVTRSADANDKYFSLFGIDYNSTMQRFEASNIYLQGMNSSADLTVTVSVQTTDQSTQLVNYIHPIGRQNDVPRLVNNQSVCLGDDDGKGLARVQYPR